MAAVRAQCYSLLGRIEGLGSGLVTASGRRKNAMEMESQWRRETGFGLQPGPGTPAIRFGSEHDCQAQ